MPNRDMSSFVPAKLRSQATSLRVVRGSIATTPFRVVCGPITMPLLPTMIHPSSAAADRRPAQDRYGSKGGISRRRAHVCSVSEGGHHRGQVECLGRAMNRHMQRNKPREDHLYYGITLKCDEHGARFLLHQGSIGGSRFDRKRDRRRKTMPTLAKR
jgi:hypothetical protein